MRYLFLLALLSGCAGEALYSKAGADSAPGGAEFDDSGNQLRIDVIPSSVTPELTAQSWITPLDADLLELNIRVTPSITVTGTVLGYEATPYGAEVPGSESVPIDAQVTLIRPGTINGSSIATNASGQFTLSVPPSGGYRLSIVPRDAPSIPFFVESGLSLTEDTDFGDIDLGHGEPIYGKVLYHDGDPVTGAQVRAVDPLSGVAGPSTLTDAQGHYMIRAEPGTLEVKAGGNPGTYLPTLVHSVDVAEEAGIHLSFDMGDISPVQVAGTVIGASSGAREKDIKVRFRSASLDEVDGTLEVETETDGDGLFSRSILPGAWIVEFIPPFDSDRSPVVFSFDVDANQGTPVNLDDIELPERVRIQREIVDPWGSPLPGAVVNAREVGFDGYIYSATADIDGRIDMELPATDMELTLVPPTTGLAVSRIQLNPATDSDTLQVVEGQSISGVVWSEGASVPFALVEVRDTDGTLLASSVTGPDGNFTVQIEAD